MSPEYTVCTTQVYIIYILRAREKWFKFEVFVLIFFGRPFFLLVVNRTTFDAQSTVRLVYFHRSRWVFNFLILIGECWMNCQFRCYFPPFGWPFGKSLAIDTGFVHTRYTDWSESFYYIMFADDCMWKTIKSTTTTATTANANKRAVNIFRFILIDISAKQDPRGSETRRRTRDFSMCSFIWQQRNLIHFVFFFFAVFPLQR